MNPVLEMVLRLLLWVLLAPLIPGIINRVKAWMAGRKGPPLLLLYYDLFRLWKKGVVISHAASGAFVAGPAIVWVAIAAAVLLLPVGSTGAPLSFRGDMVLLLYLLALARFGTVWAAMETGSSFEGMGASREVSFAVIAEVAFATALLALCLHSGSTLLGEMLRPAPASISLLLASGLFILLLSENCRVPFDDPNTHLELTMIHEVMVLDHSGPMLAVILHGASMKLLLFSTLLVQTVLPIAALPPLAAMGLWCLGVVVVSVAIAGVESLIARSAFNRVPLLLTIAFLLCLFALILAWKEGWA
jgi:formate hydrogenlyase subunit 4